MNKLFRTVLMAALSFGLLLSQSNSATAQTVKDRAVLVYKVASIDDVLDTVGYTARSAGFGEFVPMITLSAGAFLDGFDTSKPIGGYVSLTDNGPQNVTFIPVKDFEDVVDMLGSNGVDLEKEGDDYILAAPNMDIIVRPKGNWAFISNSEDALKDLPADPAKLVAGISNDYVMGVKVYVQRVPADMRSMAIEWMEEAFEEANRNIPGGAAEFQRKINENSLDQLATIIQETDEIFFGFAANKQKKSLYFDFSITGKKGSELAKNLVAGKGSTTEFGGLLENKDAAITFNASSKISKSDADNAKKTFTVIKEELGKMIRDEVNEEDLELIESLVGDIVDSVNATFDTGKVDAGGAVLIDDNGLNVIFGGHFADAKKIEAALKRVVDAKGSEAPPQIDISMNAETYKGATFHTLSGPIDEDELEPVFGDKATLVVAVSKSKVFVGFGASPIEKVKSMIDGLKQSKVKPPTQINVKLSPILRLVGKANGDPIFNTMADKLEKKGNQRIRITGDYIENGQLSRFEIEDGILSLIRVAANNLGGLGGGGFGGDF